MKINSEVFAFFLFCITSFIYPHDNVMAQANITAKKYNISPFELEVIDANFSEAYSHTIIITSKELRVVFKSGEVGEHDSLLFLKSLSPSDTLQQISNINLNGLKKIYENICVADGSQIVIISKKNEKTKSVQLSNYYREDIAKIIYLVNDLLPEQYKVFYDKKELLADSNICK
jgi:hypothetical protein